MPKLGKFNFFWNNKSQIDKKPNICSFLQNERRDLLQKQSIFRDEFKREYPSALNTIVRKAVGESISTSEVVQSAITLSRPLAVKFDLKINQMKQDKYGCNNLMERERQEKVKREEEFRQIEEMRKRNETLNKVSSEFDRQNNKSNVGNKK